jgi:hypothetical protein
VKPGLRYCGKGWACWKPGQYREQTTATGRTTKPRLGLYSFICAYLWLRLSPGMGRSTMMDQSTVRRAADDCCTPRAHARVGTRVGEKRKGGAARSRRDNTSWNSPRRLLIDRRGDTGSDSNRPTRPGHSAACSFAASQVCHEKFRPAFAAARAEASTMRTTWDTFVASPDRKG